MKQILLSIPLVAAIVNMSVEALEVDKFDAKAFDVNDRKELTEKDPFVACGVNILQLSLRAHYDELLAKNKSNLLREDNCQYFLTTHKVIPEELAKMMFGIKIKNDNVYYKNRSKDEIIKCNSQDIQLYKSIEAYSPSNWNYLLFINVLNQVKNGNATINESLIRETAKQIANTGKYNKYARNLGKAANDIVEYFNELELYRYLEKMRKFDWNEAELGELTSKDKNEILRKRIINRLRKLTGLECLFTQHTIEFDKYSNEDISKITIRYKNSKGEENTTKVYKIKLKAKSSCAPELDAKSNRPLLQRQELSEEDSMHVLMEMDKRFEVEQNKVKAQELLEKAQGHKLEQNEENFLQYYFEYLKIRQFLSDDDYIAYERDKIDEGIWNFVRKIRRAARQSVSEFILPANIVPEQSMKPFIDLELDNVLTRATEAIQG